MLVFCTVASTSIWAQFPTTGGGPPPSSTSPREDEIEEPDTVGIFYFLPSNPNEEIPFSDSLLNNYFHQYDPVRKRTYDQIHLGNLGSAHHNILYTPLLRKGFDIGLHQFDLYQVNASQLNFYRLGKAFTNLAYYQGSEQADSYFTGEFSRNFANGINFSLDYRRIAQLGTLGQYPNQNTRNTAITFGIFIDSPKGNYDAFLIYAANTIEQEDNGGIAVEPSTSEEFDDLNSADVFLDDAQTRYSHRELQYTHYYKFGGQLDSIKGLTRAYTLSHDLRYKTSKYKFSDLFDGTTRPSSEDSLFYRDFLVDPRGVRHFTEHIQLENSFRISTFRLNTSGPSAARNQKDLIELGITHTYHALDQEATDSVINNLFLNGKITFNPGPKFRIDTYGHLGLWDNAGDYQIKGKLLIDLEKWGRLKVEAINQLYAPNLIQHRFFVNQEEIWKNDFSKTLETNLTATYELPSIGLQITGGYHLLNNYIYFDSLSQPVQTGIPISIAQLTAAKDFKFWHLHLENVITLQQASEDVIRFPDIYTKHSFYYEGLWFKVLLVRLGTDLRLNNDYFGYYYQPVNGQFQLENNREIEFYPALDAYFSFKVSTFRAFFKWENLTSSFIDNQFFYQTAFYAHPRGALRFGIKWKFSN